MGERKHDRVFVLKVALKGAKRIWRRIAIRGSQTLEDLHWIIYDAYDRYDEHLYAYYFPGYPSRAKRALDRFVGIVEYVHPMVLEEADPFADHRIHDASRTTIESLKLTQRQKFDYLFDFGDEWWHELTVEQISGEPDQEAYPRVIEKKGESPPQYPDIEDGDNSVDEDD
jgi:pRiA4b ORF-3-like protein